MPNVKIESTQNGILSKITEKVEVIPNVKVTPKIAESLLQLNTANRPITLWKVEQYTNDMEAGRWIFAGNTIKFSNDRVMRDGQHQLLSVIQSNTTQTFNLQCGLDPSSFNVMDIGKLRSGADILAMKGFVNYNALAAAVKKIITFKAAGVVVSRTQAQSISNIEVDAWSEKKGEMKILAEGSNLLETFRGQKKGRFLSISSWAFLYYVLYKINKEQAIEFISRLHDGQDISMKNYAPIYLLRELLQTSFGSEHISTLRSGGSQVTGLKFKYIFRAWNAWRSDEKITKLVINLKEETPEKPI